MKKHLQSIEAMISRKLAIFFFVAGLALAVGSVGIQRTVSAQSCGRDMICGCVTNNVFCNRDNCSPKQVCIWETGVCSFGYLACGFSYCSGICGL